MAKGRSKGANSKEPLNLTIVFAPSGVGLNRSISKFSKWLKKKHTSFNLIHSDVEESLLAIARERGLITSKRARIKEVIKNYPRELVRTLWDEAFQRSVESICSRAAEIKTSNDLLPIITGHCVYYHPTQPQFYVPLHCGYIRLALSKAPMRFKIRRVALLIDDIHDMYRRLCGENEILDHHHACRTALKDYWMRKSVEPNISILQEKNQVLLGRNDQERMVSLQTILEQFGKLLNWRLQEKTIAEHLARELNAQFVLFATKQSSEVFLGVLLGRKTVYVSHPITAPRREIGFANNELVKAVNKIPSLLTDYACISPTAIDELRLMHVTEYPYGGALNLRNGSLSERWPFLAAKSNLLWDPPKNNLPKNEEFLKLEAKYLHDRISIDSLIAPLQDSIMLQVAHRDHILVANSDAMIIVRNYYSGHTSKGVAEEILHWVRRVQHEKKPTVFILYPQDMKDMTRFIHKDSFRNRLKESMIEYLCQATDIPEDQLNRMSRERGNSPLSSMDPEEGNRMRESLGRENLSHHLLKLILPDLCALQIEPSSAALVLCINNEQLFESGSRIQKFLHEGCEEEQAFTVLTEFWQGLDVKDIESVLDIQPIGWDEPHVDSIKSMRNMIDQEIRVWTSRVS